MHRHIGQGMQLFVLFCFGLVVLCCPLTRPRGAFFFQVFTKELNEGKVSVVTSPVISGDYKTHRRVTAPTPPETGAALLPPVPASRRSLPSHSPFLRLSPSLATAAAPISQSVFQ